MNEYQLACIQKKVLSGHVAVGPGLVEGGIEWGKTMPEDGGGE